MNKNTKRKKRLTPHENHGREHKHDKVAWKPASPNGDGPSCHEQAKMLGWVK